MDIQAHIIGELALHKDVIQQPVVPRTRRNRMMPKVRPFSLGPFGAEIPNIKPHGPSRLFEATIRPPLFHMIAQKVGICVARICVADDQGAFHSFA